MKDPDAFGPPPKNLAYNGGAASPHTTTPDRRGLGAPLASQEIQGTNEYQREEQAAEEFEQRAAPQPVPYRADTTGLSTSNLPKPPVRHLRFESQPGGSPASPSSKPKPALPPRLPPRQNSASAQGRAPSSPARGIFNQDQNQNGYISQGSLNRLGSAGVSVPGFGIGGGSQEANPWKNQEGSNSSICNAQGPQLSELQSRFSKMSTKSQNLDSPAQGTSFAQKQAALKTASSFRNDPYSVSLADAKATASTANNFRERHGDQVAAGWKNASLLNTKYDVANKVNGSAANGSVPSGNETVLAPARLDTPTASLKKRAPPPPPKKPLVDGSPTPSPPPIPLSSKPR